MLSYSNNMRTFAIALFVFFACLPTGMALAQINPSPGGNQNPSPGGNPSSGQSITLINPLGAGIDLPTLLNKILDFVVNIGAIIVVFMLVYVGFLYVTARGNETKITVAHQALLWTVVGALILLGAKAIAAGIMATTQALSTGG